MVEGVLVLAAAPVVDAAGDARGAVGQRVEIDVAVLERDRQRRNFRREIGEARLAALLEAQAAGLRVWRTTRCASGRALLAGSSPDPIPPVALPPAQARLALLLDLLTV